MQVVVVCVLKVHRCRGASHQSQRVEYCWLNELRGRTRTTCVSSMDRKRGACGRRLHGGEDVKTHLPSDPSKASVLLSSPRAVGALGGCQVTHRLVGAPCTLATSSGTSVFVNDRESRGSKQIAALAAMRCVRRANRRHRSINDGREHLSPNSHRNLPTIVSTPCRN